MSQSSNQPAQPAVPRHASTVLLLRQSGDNAEVLVTRRHEKLAFMGGQWVFPGGTLANADTSADALALIPPSSQQRCAQLADMHGTPLPPAQCLGLAVAACRETFEETGVLLARAAEGHECNEAALGRLYEQRRTMVSQPDQFATLLAQERLQLQVDRLVYWAHWITPSSGPRRFDTRFYLAILPPGQTVRVDSSEAVDYAWMTPAALIDASRTDTMPLSNPTLYNLMELEASLRLHGSLAAMLSAEAHRPVPPVMPKLMRTDTMVMVLPWDSEYQHVSGGGVPAHIVYPQRLLDLPSRMNRAR